MLGDIFQLFSNLTPYIFVKKSEKVNYSILSLIIKASALIFTLFPFFSVTRINPSSTGTAIKLF